MQRPVGFFGGQLLNRQGPLTAGRSRPCDSLTLLAARGSTIGVRGTRLAGAVGQSLPVLPVSLPPLRRMRELPS
ncbi:hypothetical protein ACFRU3_32630 [Streptomyces sp. NPDC056910]|uniref:hypothetical protein n=1 Tax=Streptomyces sp. NPDC056910 TaxID=3345964 RepID=UPI0036A69A9A